MVLVFAESQKGHIKKAALEAVTYGKKVATMLGSGCVAVTLGTGIAGADVLGQYGADRVLNVGDTDLNNFDSQLYAAVLGSIAKQLGATVVVLSHTATGKSIAGRVAVRLGAGLVSGVNSLPSFEGSALRVKKSVFSGKAIGEFEINSAIKVISLMGNAVRPEITGASVAVETVKGDVPAGRIRVKSVKTQEGIVPLPEAELVVSAGRGMKEASIIQNLLGTSLDPMRNADQAPPLS